MRNKAFLTLMSVALLVGGCGNRTASTQDALTQIAAADKVCFTLILGAYRYHEEGGRYSVAKTYTLAGQFIKEEETEE